MRIIYLFMPSMWMPAASAGIILSGNPKMDAKEATLRMSGSNKRMHDTVSW